MIITKKAISRRAMLRGVGAAVALPWLDSMTPALSAAGQSFNRFGVVYVPNGMIMENYLPAKDGPDYEITPTLSALEPLREHFQILSGLNCIPTPGRPGGAHAKAVMPARTPTPSAGPVPPRRCRRRTIRAWCSSGCSAIAAARIRKRVCCACASKKAFSIR